MLPAPAAIDWKAFLAFTTSGAMYGLADAQIVYHWWHSRRKGGGTEPGNWSDGDKLFRAL
jgi:hypothetical protein